MRRAGQILYYILLMLGIALDAVLWLSGIVGVAVGIWYGVPAMNHLGKTIIFIMLMLHLLIDLWPMRWANRLLERVLDRFFPLPEIRITEEKC
jgi:hypothetical protein